MAISMLAAKGCDNVQCTHITCDHADTRIRLQHRVPRGRLTRVMSP